MDKITQRWRTINERLKALELELDDTTDAFWENEEYASLFEERTKLNSLFTTCKVAVDTELVKRSYRKVNQATEDKINGKAVTTTRWITINPADGQEKAFIEKVHKFMTRPVMEGKYVFEQRGETEGDYHGIHVHALIKNYPNLRRDTLSAFKKFCDKVHIRITPCTEEDVKRREVYMGGTKEGVQKQLKVLNDPRMRTHYALLPFYTC